MLPSYGGYFVPLYNKLLSDVKSHFDFFYGFPNKNSYPFFIKLFDMKTLILEYMKESQKFLVKDYQRLYLYSKQNPIYKNIEFLKWRVLE